MSLYTEAGHVEPEDILERLIAEYPQRGDYSDPLILTWRLFLHILERLEKVEAELGI